MSRAIDLPLNPRHETAKVWTKADRRRAKRQKAKAARKAGQEARSLAS